MAISLNSLATWSAAKRTTCSYDVILPDRGSIFVFMAATYATLAGATCTIGGAAATAQVVGDAHAQQVSFWRNDLPAGTYTVTVSGISDIYNSQGKVFSFIGIKEVIAKLNYEDHATGATVSSPTMATGKVLVETYCQYTPTTPALTLNSGQTMLDWMDYNATGSLGLAYRMNVGAGTVNTSVTWANADNSYANFELMAILSVGEAGVFLSDGFGFM